MRDKNEREKVKKFLEHGLNVNEREKVKKFLEHGLNVFEVFDCMAFALRSFYIGLEKMKGVSEKIMHDQKGMMIYVLNEFVQSLYIFCFKKELTEQELKKHCLLILDRVIELFEMHPHEEVSKVSFILSRDKDSIFAELKKKE